MTPPKWHPELAIEKLLKAIVHEMTASMPPKTHDLMGW